MFRAKRRTVVTVTAVVAVLLGGAIAVTLLTSGKGDGSASASDGVVEYQAGQRPLAPNVTGTSLTGSTIKLSSYRGKTVVLNFWGSWCSPCRDEAPTLAVLDQQYGSKGVTFLGDDVGDTPANALAFTHSARITYPSISDNGYLVVADFSAAGVAVSDTPTTVVIDKTGHVAGMVIGAVSYGQLTTLIKDAAVTTQ
ncbi:MAG: redoxin [Actinomycetia bacterium]|nr:redoxin [Actinomycetes bacterium]